MGAYGEVGVLLSQVELMGWDYGRISGKGGILSEALLDMWWENISFWHDLWRVGYKKPNGIQPSTFRKIVVAIWG
jgi:hypothetical protein